MVSSERVVPAQGTILNNKASQPMKLTENYEMEMETTKLDNRLARFGPESKGLDAGRTRDEQLTPAAP